ncbi:MAG: hypothetical protein K9N07_10245 [Candidatus Cloacimonetes bacterium]|nr:hypothetical protein [Candidatus Cloacimonadota bacterium]
MNFRADVEVFVVRILNRSSLRYLRHQCPQNITDLVFLEIQNDAALLLDYNNLGVGHTRNAVNSAIGFSVKKVWNLENIRRVKKPQSTLIGSYMKHYNN